MSRWRGCEFDRGNSMSGCVWEGSIMPWLINNDFNFFRMIFVLFLTLLPCRNTTWIALTTTAKGSLTTKIPNTLITFTRAYNMMKNTNVLIMQCSWVTSPLSPWTCCTWLITWLWSVATQVQKLTHLSSTSLIHYFPVASSSLYLSTPLSFSSSLTLFISSKLSLFSSMLQISTVLCHDFAVITPLKCDLL